MLISLLVFPTLALIASDSGVATVREPVAGPVGVLWTEIAAPPLARSQGAEIGQRPTRPPSRWDNAPAQWAHGMIGGLSGMGIGLLAGGALGLGYGNAFMKGSSCGYSDSHCSPVWVGPMLAGGVLGMLVGDVVGTGLAVKWSSEEPYPSRGVGPALLGSALGFAVCAGAGMLVVQESGVPWLGAAGVFVGPALGAVWLDRLAARGRVEATFAPWVPKPGQPGMRVGLVF